MAFKAQQPESQSPVLPENTFEDLHSINTPYRVVQFYCGHVPPNALCVSKKVHFKILVSVKYFTYVITVKVCRPSAPEHEVMWILSSKMCCGSTYPTELPVLSLH